MTEKCPSQIAAQFEPTLHGATFVSEMRKPFDLVAEGLLSGKSRGSKEPLELFLAGVGVWDSGLQRQLDDEKLTST
jgi:hypothetical protein